MANRKGYTATDNPYSQYNFELEIDGQSVAGFSDVSGLTMELETVEYQEGGVNDHIHSLPGQFSHANLVLQRGLTKETAFSDWIHEVMSGTIKKQTVVIKLKSGFKGESAWGWEFRNAYPTKWSGPDLTGGKNGMAIESIELTYERFTKLSGMPK